jgi:hypothetical protein
MDKYVIGGKWLNDLHSDLSGSDRSCAVLAGAILDDRLSLILRAYLLPPRGKGKDKLLGRSGIIDSFSSRIELACRLNLISERLTKSLDWIREIRNDAAHNTEFEFANHSIKDRVNNIVTVMELLAKSPTLLNPPYAGEKGRFVVAVILLTACLEIEAGEMTHTSYKPTDVFERFTIEEETNST